MQYNAPFGSTDPNASFVNGNPATGVAGSIPPAQAFEQPQREILSVIAAAGIAPSATDMTQLLQAIRFLASPFFFGVDTSTVANNILVIPAPAITVLAAGTMLIVKAGNNNTGATTLTFGTAAQIAAGTATTSNIKRGDLSALQSGDIRTGGMLILEYDGAEWQLLANGILGGSGSGSGGSGSAGANGTTWYTGVSAPAPTLGVNGDFFLISNGGVYQKVSGSWGAPLFSILGPQGIQGLQGLTGAPCNISIGSVATGAAGSAASVTVTGTAPNFTLNVTIPAGPQGATGPQGSTGPTGPAGANGVATFGGIGSVYTHMNAFSTNNSLSGTWTLLYSETGYVGGQTSNYVLTMNYSSATNPAWANDKQNAIRLTIKFDHLPDAMSFLATSYDVEPHGAQIFNDAKAGKFGPVAPYVAPIPIFDPNAVKADCQRRILTVASQNAQNNMGLYMGSGAATDADKAAIVAWLTWVAAMRSACSALIAASDLTFTLDSHWPICPPIVVTFAARF
eukprot:gene18400-18669_t